MLIQVHPRNPEEKKLQKAAGIIRKGGLAIYPTDTVYALGCDIYNNKAFEKVCRIKGIKPEKANFSFICYDLSHISDYTKPFDTAIYKLMKKALPGPFTFILNANSSVPRIFKNNKSTIGIRVPDNNIVRQLVKELGNPLLSTSLHDEDQLLEYPTDPNEIQDKYEKLVDIVIDGGYGDMLPSTVVDCTSGVPMIARSGKGQIYDFL